MTRTVPLAEFEENCAELVDTIEKEPRQADTHAWIWWIAQPDLLSPSAAAAMADGFGVAAISCWEVGCWRRNGALRLMPKRWNGIRDSGLVQTIW